MNETFTKGAWYALKTDASRKGRAVSILKRSVCLAMNGDNENRVAFLREQLQPITPPDHPMPGKLMYRSVP